MKTRETAVAEAIEFIKTCPLKGKFIKLELEANLERGDGDYYEEYEDCHECNGYGEFDCNVCDNVGVEVCEDCNNTGQTTCDNCGGDGQTENSSFNNSDDSCQEFILSSVSNDCRRAITYSTFYYDGSVDSEFSVTIPLDKPEYAIELIKAFKDLAGNLGNGLDTEGAGMHIAILSDPQGRYGRYDDNKILKGHWQNFQSSVSHLLPALLFLASADHKSRGLGYRVPSVSNDKGACISLREDSVIEWRVFETCYDRPEMFYDYLCVIANTLKFYTAKRISLPFFNKIGKLGLPDDGYGVHRFFYTEKHLEALEAGLAVLRPAFRTQAECYKLRNFKVSKAQLRRKTIKQTIAAESEWGYLRRNRKQKLLEVKETALRQATREVEMYMSWGEHSVNTEAKRAAYIETNVSRAVRKFNEHNPSTKKGYINYKLNNLNKFHHMVTV